MKMELEIARNISASEAKTSGICSSVVSHATNYFRYSTRHPTLKYLFHGPTPSLCILGWRTKTE